VYHSTVSSN